MTVIPQECIPGPDKSPPWLKQPGVVATDYTTKQWYLDWLTTTTSLCTDLSRLAADNPEHHRIVWRTDHAPLFLFIDRN